jgi:ABC-type antimicrobial peptide transport system permease subunit
VRYAVRQALKTPGSTLASFLILTAGIAATSAMFSVMSGVLLRPVPVKDADGILRLNEINSRTGAELQVSMTDFVDWKSRLHAFSAMALYRVSQGNLTGLGARERVRILQCDTTMLHLVGVLPAMGRNFSPVSFLKIPLSQNIQLDWRVLLFSTSVAVLTGIGFGLVPAIRASLVQVGDALRRSSTRNTDSPAQQNLNRSFVVLQAALAASLLVFSGLLLRSFVRASHPSHYRQIVGIVRDVHQLGVEKEAIPEVFLPVYQVEEIWLAIVARTNGDPMKYVTVVRKAVQSVDPEIAVFLPRTIERIVSEQRGWRKFETSLVSSFAAVAILLAAVGSYAVVSYAVTQRFSEIGIRMALGATNTSILKSFTLQGCIPAILGTCLGILLGFWAGRLSARLLYGIGPYDALSYCGAAIVLMFVAVAANYLLARRAASLDPWRALRYE